MAVSRSKNTTSIATTSQATTSQVTRLTPASESQTIMAARVSNENISTNTPSDPSAVPQRQKMGCFARIRQFFQNRKQKVLESQKHPISHRQKPSLLVRLGLKKEKKIQLTPYEILQGKKILNAFKFHSNRLRNKEPDELGNKTLIYKDPINGDKKYFYFHENKPIGCINFTKDQFVAKDPKITSGKYKTVTHQNDKTIFFSHKESFKEKEINLEEKQQFYKNANSKNKYFANKKHMYSAYYVKKEDQVGMIAKVAGQCSGKQLMLENRSIPILAFKGALKELESLMKAHIYIADIKPDNMMVNKINDKSYEVNFIDIDTNIYDASSKGKAKELYDLLIPGTAGYSDDMISFCIHNAKQDRNLTEYRSLFRVGNYYAFLLSMFFMTSGYKITKFSDEGKFDAATELRESNFESALDRWCQKAIRKKYISKIKDLITCPSDFSKIGNISHMINWDYVASVQQQTPRNDA